MMRRAAIALAMIVLLGCARQAVPADLDTVNTACRFCRMAVSDVHFAAQIAGPGVESQFFDDVGCLRDYLRQASTKLPADAVVFVADHRTGAWVRATTAVFTRIVGASTPMNGGIIAHASDDSKKQDAAAAGGAPVPASDILGAAGPSKGGRP